MALSAAVPAGVALIAAATLAGAWLAGSRLAGRAARWRGLPMTCAAAVLAAVVLADLVPDTWRDLHRAGLPWWIAAGAAACGFAVAEVLRRRGCACDRVPGPHGDLGGGASAAAEAPARRRGPGGHHGGSAAAEALPARRRPGSHHGASAAAAALSAHRALEGAAIALAGSAGVIAALALHAAGEGFALAALLRGERRGRAAAWLALACLSPAAGAVTLTRVPLPAAASPVVTSLIAGVLLRTALAAWRLRLPARRVHDHGGFAALFDDNSPRSRNPARRTAPRALSGTASPLTVQRDKATIHYRTARQMTCGG